MTTIIGTNSMEHGLDLEPVPLTDWLGKGFSYGALPELIRPNDKGVRFLPYRIEADPKYNDSARLLGRIEYPEGRLADHNTIFRIPKIETPEDLTLEFITPDDESLRGFWAATSKKFKFGWKANVEPPDNKFFTAAI